MKRRKFEFTATEDDATIINVAAGQKGLAVAAYLRMAALELARTNGVLFVKSENARHKPGG